MPGSRENLCTKRNNYALSPPSIELTILLQPSMSIIRLRGRETHPLSAPWTGLVRGFSANCFMLYSVSISISRTASPPSSSSIRPARIQSRPTSVGTTVNHRYKKVDCSVLFGEGKKARSQKLHSRRDNRSTVLRRNSNGLTPRKVLYCAVPPAKSFLSQPHRDTVIHVARESCFILEAHTCTVK